MTLAELESLLDAFGGDPSRWPAERRSAAEALIARNAEAREALAGAVALDRLLGQASDPQPQRLEALADRIMAATLHDAGTGVEAEGPASVSAARDKPRPGSAAPSDARVISLPERRRPQAPASSPTHPQSPWRSFAGAWPSAAALAASLLLGIAIGTTDYGSTTALDLVAVADARTTSDTEIVLASLQGGDFSGVIEEDQQ